jgi:5'-nucleotidase
MSLWTRIKTVWLARNYLNSKGEMKLILVTNDDGIESPGLLAAAGAMLPLGQVVVAAPREQQTSTGRSLPTGSDGRIEHRQLDWDGQALEAYAVGGTPAQAVLHAVLEILPRQPDIVVSGINYGENVGSGVTISGTVGAALEAGALGLPALAVSLQMLSENWYSYEQLDFSAAAHFAAYFARAVLERGLPVDADLLKIEVPVEATPQTAWKLVRQSRQRYYNPYLVRTDGWNEPGYVSARIQVERGEVEPDSDVYALLYEKIVAVTPLSVDLTARVNWAALDHRLRETTGD